MKKLVTVAAVIAAFGLVNAASAADMPTKAPFVKAPIAPVYNWTGFYVGGSLGYGWGSSDWTFDPVGSSPTPNPIKSNGWVGGGQIGYQHQWNNIVLGVEAQYLFGGLKGSATCPNPTFACNIDRVDNIFLVGPRVGLAFANWMPYVTGGYASARVKSIDFSPTVSEPSSSQNPGYFIGGGLDYMLMPNVIVGIEYDHLSLKSQHQVSPVFSPGDDRNVDFKGDMVRGRVSYLFNWP